MTKRYAWPLAVALGASLAVAAFAASAGASGKKKGKKGDEADMSDSSGVDKARFESYLKDRLGKIQEAHKARMDFFDKEKAGWEDFWTKIKDDRRKFEIRITRQTLDLFESLASIDPKDQGSTIANYEKLQTDLIRSFETQQKQKMLDFFADHDAKWKDFAGEQEKERAAFVADAEAGWQQNKSDLKTGKTSAEDAGGDEDAPKHKPAKKAPAKKSALNDKEDVWH